MHSDSSKMAFFACSKTGESATSSCSIPKMSCHLSEDSMPGRIARESPNPMSLGPLANGL